jgi:uncharacterized protein (DUF2141 family)
MPRRSFASITGRSALCRLGIGTVTTLAAASAGVAGASGMGSPQRVEFRISGVQSGATLLVALCDQRNFLSADCPTLLQLKAAGSIVYLSLAVPQPGRWAVRMVEDRNGNGRLDRTGLGRPREPIGLSRNPRPRVGPPRFDHVAVDFAGAARPERLHIEMTRTDGAPQ